MGAPDRDVGAEFARRRQKGQAQEIRGHDDQRARRMGLFNEGPVIVDGAIGGGILKEHGKNRRLKIEALMVAHQHFQSQSLGARLDHSNGLRMAAARNKDRAAVAF